MRPRGLERLPGSQRNARSARPEYAPNSVETAKARNHREAFVERSHIADEPFALKHHEERVVEVEPSGCGFDDIQDVSEEPLDLVRQEENLASLPRRANFRNRGG